MLGVAMYFLLSEYGAVTSNNFVRGEVRCSRIHVLKHWPQDLSHITCGCVSSVTVVTAYFNIGAKSKHDEPKFHDWNSRFFLLADDMVIFTDVLTSKIIFQARNNSPGCTIIFEQQAVGKGPSQFIRSSAVVDEVLFEPIEPCAPRFAVVRIEQQLDVNCACSHYHKVDLQT